MSTRVDSVSALALAKAYTATQEDLYGILTPWSDCSAEWKRNALARGRAMLRALRKMRGES